MERVIIALIHFAILAGASDPAPITPSPSEDDAPSSVDISSGVGTWVAAGVAIVALVSIVGPWSVLRQSSRDWRRALAGVYDRDGTYIDYVVKFPGSKYRFWRIERIPDLAPLHDENSLSNPPLLAVREVSGLLDWEAPSYRRWNTGWLKLCALIDGLSIAGNDTTAENAIAGNATVENATEENAAAENVAAENTAAENTAAENTAAENTAAQATSKTATRRATGNDGNSDEELIAAEGSHGTRVEAPESSNQSKKLPDLPAHNTGDRSELARSQKRPGIRDWIPVIQKRFWHNRSKDSRGSYELANLPPSGAPDSYTRGESTGERNPAGSGTNETPLKLSSKTPYLHFRHRCGGGDTPGGAEDRLEKGEEPRRELSRSGGRLELVNSRTALAVNKNWILVIGLLGRYSAESSSDMRGSTLIHADIPGERGSDYGSIDDSASSSSASSLVRSDTSHCELRRPLGNTGPTPAPTVPSRYRIHRAKFGEWVLWSGPRPTLRGYTGTLQSMGRHQGPSADGTIVYPHPANEIREITGSVEATDIARPGVNSPKTPFSKRQMASLRTQFWLAHGCLCSGSDGDKYNVISLEDPSYPEGKKSREETKFLTRHGYDNGVGSHHFGLEATSNLPLRMVESARALQMGSFKLKRWTGIKEMEAKYTLQAYQDQDGKLEHDTHFRAEDLLDALEQLFSIDWDDWGYLVRRTNCTLFDQILHRRAGLFRESRVGSFLWDVEQPVDFKTYERATDWKLEHRYFGPKTKDYVALGRAIEARIDKQKLRIPLACLFVANDDFLEDIRDALIDSDVKGKNKPSRPRPSPGRRLSSPNERTARACRNFNHQFPYGYEKVIAASGKGRVCGLLALISSIQERKDRGPVPIPLVEELLEVVRSREYTDKQDTLHPDGVAYSAEQLALILQLWSEKRGLQDPLGLGVLWEDTRTLEAVNPSSEEDVSLFWVLHNGETFNESHAWLGLRPRTEEEILNSYKVTETQEGSARHSGKEDIEIFETKKTPSATPLPNPEFSLDSGDEEIEVEASSRVYGGSEVPQLGGGQREDEPADRSQIGREQISAKGKGIERRVTQPKHPLPKTSQAHDGQPESSKAARNRAGPALPTPALFEVKQPESTKAQESQQQTARPSQNTFQLENSQISEPGHASPPSVRPGYDEAEIPQLQDSQHETTHQNPIQPGSAQSSRPVNASAPGGQPEDAQPGAATIAKLPHYFPASQTVVILSRHARKHTYKLRGADLPKDDLPVSKKDLCLIAIWASVRCAIWLSSDDSMPLLKFVGDLDRTTWVL